MFSSKNNLNHILEKSVGYDNLMERLVSPDKAEELSNNNVFDEMLSEYFIDKRKQVKSAKSLLSHMDQHFDVDKYTPRGLRTA